MWCNNLFFITRLKVEKIKYEIRNVVSYEILPKRLIFEIFLIIKKTLCAVCGLGIYNVSGTCNTLHKS